MAVDVVTFGCRLNTYESEVMKREAEARALAPCKMARSSSIPAPLPAKLCARPGKPSARHAGIIREARIIVTGCAAQTER